MEFEVMPKNYTMNEEEFLSKYEADLKKAQAFQYLQYFLLAICWISLIAAFYFKLSGTLTHLITPLGLIGMFAGLGSWLAGKKLLLFINRTKAVRQWIANVEKEIKEQEHLSGKIPLSIGFCRLTDDQAASNLEKDFKDISKLFAKSVVGELKGISDVQILFLYAKLNDDGTIESKDSLDIRQVAQLANAKIVVIASNNTSNSIQKALELPGQKNANLVFTLKRNGKHFSKFFVDLFNIMATGKHMLEAWVELEPQTPQVSSENGPQTLLVAEGGKIAFPASIQAK